MTPGRTTRMDHSGLSGARFNVGASTSSQERKKTGETIHSGQFMVSHFETEGQEDEDDDDLGMQVVVEDVKPAIVDTVLSNIISKRNPELSMHSAADLIAGSSNAVVPLGSGLTGMELIKYEHKRQPLQLTGRNSSSQVEIDTDLSTVFNTLNVTYTQKLTSPKWNPFKGIRLRWKEKIRLNNVIWRCWHMQFIMKRKTLVCQFASPLDVDVHNTPQAILLEGKYWKRKCNVIKAEYKKWRRFYVNKALGANNIVDTTSELDFFEWSPQSSEPLFMITDSMPTDTLFSTLSQYPFPDSREIARGAGRADFIQPSLGPLQPNFDDLMDLDLDFFRLAPVPEEGSEDILRAIEYNYPGGSNQMNSGTSIQEITDSPEGTNQQPSPQLVPTRTASSNSSVITGPGTSAGINQQQQSSVPSIVAQSVSDNTASASSVIIVHQQQQLSSPLGNYLGVQFGQQPAIVVNNVPLGGSISESSRSAAGSSDDIKKDIKPKLSRSFPRHLGREPHNYDRSAPTTHQTMAYTHVSQPPQIDPNMHNNSYPNVFLDVRPGGIIPEVPENQNLLNYNLEPSQPPVSQPPNAVNLSGRPSLGLSNQNLVMQNLNSNLLTHSQSLPPNNQPANQSLQPRSISMPTAQGYSPLAPQPMPSTSRQHQHQQEAFRGSLHPQSSSYRSYHSHQPQPYTIPSQNPSSYGNSGRSMRHASPPHGHQHQQLPNGMMQQPSIEQSQQQLQDLQLQQASSSSQQKRIPPHPAKEMIRSNSLPINASLPLAPREENFAVPRFQAKTTPKRSKSMVIKQPGSGSPIASTSGTNQPPNIHAASSEPALNINSSALLAQLLSPTNPGTIFNVRQQPTSPSAISNLQTSQQNPHQAIVQPPQQHQQQLQQPTYQQQSPLASPISSNSSQLHLNQSQQSPQQLSRTSTPAQNSGSSFSSASSYNNISTQTQNMSPVMEFEHGRPMPIANMLPPGSSEASMCRPSTSRGSPSTPSNSRGGASIPSASPIFASRSNPQQPETSRGRGIGARFHLQRIANHRRSGHIHAEQRRRGNIKNGFDMLHSIIPVQNPNAKMSKAALLQRGALYITELKRQQDERVQRIDNFRREIARLNDSIIELQLSLPASGVPVLRQRTGRVRELFNSYVRERSYENWKFWVFAMMIEAMMNSFNDNVSISSLDELYRSCQLWVDQHCSLVELRPILTNTLRRLSTTTNLLSNRPSTLEEEARNALAQSVPLSSSSGSTPGPSGRSARGPSTSAFPGPSSRSFPGPSSRSAPGRSSRSLPGPSTSGFPGPSTSSFPSPITSGFPGPSTSSFPSSSTSGLDDPSSISFPGPSTSYNSGISIRRFPGPGSSICRGPRASNFPGPSTSGFRNPGTSSFPGPSTSDPGPSSRIFPGPSSGSFPSPSGSSTPGPSGTSAPGASSSGFPGGPSSRIFPGPSSGSFSGPSGSSTPGRSGTGTPGQNNSTPSPSSNNQRGSNANSPNPPFGGFQ